MSPDTWTQDLALLATPQDRRIQIQLLQDYQNNIDSYPAWQAFLRKQQPPDAHRLGQERRGLHPRRRRRAYLRDLPNAELHLIDAGHFAVEEQAVLIAKYMVHFLDRLPTEPVQASRSSP